MISKKSSFLVIASKPGLFCFPKRKLRDQDFFFLPFTCRKALENSECLVAEKTGTSLANMKKWPRWTGRQIQNSVKIGKYEES